VRRRRAAEARDPGARGLGYGGEASSAQELSSAKQSLGGVEPQRLAAGNRLRCAGKA
jgi:hypothetical protein